MHIRLASLYAVTTALLVLGSAAGAQQTATRKRSSAAAPASAPVPASTAARARPAAGASKGGAKVASATTGASKRGDSTKVSTAEGEIDEALVTVAPLKLRRDAVKSIDDKLSAADKSSPKQNGFLAGLTKTVTGDKHRVEAAERVLGQMAQSLASDSSISTTVVVVVGNDADRDKVVQSLAGVRRKVKVAYVDRSLSDATSDNTALDGGLVGKATTAAKNMWIYLPTQGGAPRDKPNYTLSTKVATPALWNGMFAADGDEMDLDRMRLTSHADSAPSHDTLAKASVARQNTSATAPAVGDVVLPKIANVKVLADAKADSKVVGTLSKTDELVVAGAPQNGFIRVEGATLSGWVSVVLVVKR